MTYCYSPTKYMDMLENKTQSEDQQEFRNQSRGLVNKCVGQEIISQCDEGRSGNAPKYEIEGNVSS